MSEIAEDIPEEVPGEGDQPLVEDEDLGGLSVEAQARIAGWNPDHPAGKSAEEFLARNQEKVGLLRSENEKLYSEIGSLKQGMAQVAKFLESREAKAREDGYNRAIAQYKRQMQEAVDDSDRSKFDQADKAIQELEKRKLEDKVDPIIETPPEEHPIAKAVNEHKSKNPHLFDLASKEKVWMEELRAQGQSGKSYEESVKAADQAVVQMFNIKRNMPGLNEGGPAGKGGATRLSQIPGATEAFNILKAKIPDLTEEEYLAEVQE